MEILKFLALLLQILSFSEENHRDCSEVMFGIWQPPVPGEFNPLVDVENRIGMQSDIVPWYQAWGNPETSNYNSHAVDWVHSRGSIPMITWEPWDTRASFNDPIQLSYSMSSVIDGYHDDYIRDWARQASVADGEIYLRFAHEANGFWYPWSPSVSGKDPEVYKAAWRHVVKIFRAEGAVNVKFVWSPNRNFDGATPLISLYPSDDFVDVIGLDGYNFGDDGNGQRFRSFNDTFLDSYLETRRWSEKPVMIAETGSSNNGGNRSIWLSEGLSITNLTTNYPDLIAVVYFNQDGSGPWELQESDGSLEALSQVVKGWECD